VTHSKYPGDAGRQVQELIAVAVAALTAAARTRRTSLGGQSRPVDFGEIACQVITTVAANVGGVEELLAGRPLCCPNATALT
jgi:hypothetical protein